MIRGADARNLFVMVNFTTAECTGGALVRLKHSSCFRCEGDDYSFTTSRQDCLPCEPFALCTGTTVLVPKPGYWHSSPFSPFIHRCVILEACVFANRTRLLTAYYNTSSFVQKQLDNFNSSEWGWSQDCSSDTCMHSQENKEHYLQCAEGYAGVLCGSCSDGYGHTADGKCKRCTTSYAQSCVIVALLFASGFFVMLVKLAFGVDGVKTEVAYSISAEKAKVRDVLSRASGQQHMKNEASASTKQTVQATKSSTHPLTEQKETTPQQHDEGTSDNPPSASSVSQVHLARSEPVEERSLMQDDQTTVSAEITTASGVLADTFNVRRSCFLLLSLLQFLCRFCLITFN